MCVLNVQAKTRAIASTTCDYACMTPRWDDLHTLLWMVRCKTLAGAADSLGINYTTVARRITRLETALNTRLFDRSPDGYVPTEQAIRMCEHAENMEQAQHAMLRSREGSDQTLAGPFTITAPQLLIASCLAPTLGAFVKAHPDIDLNIRATNELLDLSRREADVAIRISRSPGDTLTGLRLTEQDNASFATQDWLDRITANPSDQIDWIVYEQTPTVPKGTDPTYTNQRVLLRFDDMNAMQGAAQAGLGVVRLPMFLGRSTPGLVQVPVLPPVPYADIWLVGHPDVWPSAKVKAVRDHLKPYFKANRHKFVRSS